MVDHFEVVLNNSLKEFECDMCGDNIDETEDLNKHKEMNHNPIEYFTCNECGYILIDEKKMKKHKLKELRSYLECENCDSKFGIEEDLILHLESCPANNNLESTFVNPSFVKRDLQDFS